MNFKDLAGPLDKKLRNMIEKNKIVMIVILAGALLITLSNVWNGDTNRAEETAESVNSTFDLEKIEKEVETALSRIEGAGNVTVVLTVKTGTRQILAEDGESRQGDDGSERSTSPVIVSKGSGYQEAVTVQEIFPQYQGALVVCAGGGNPAVKLKLVEAVSALTGLGSDKISICKGK